MFPRPRRKSKLQAFIDLNQCALSRACFETADPEAPLQRRSCDGRGGAALAYEDHNWLNTVAVNVQPVQVTDAPAPWNLFRAATSSLGRGSTGLVTGFWGSVVVCRVRSAPLGLTSVGVLALYMYVCLCVYIGLCIHIYIYI